MQDAQRSRRDIWKQPALLSVSWRWGDEPWPKAGIDLATMSPSPWSDLGRVSLVLPHKIIQHVSLP